MPYCHMAATAVNGLIVMNSYTNSTNSNAKTTDSIAIMTIVIPNGTNSICNIPRTTMVTIRLHTTHKHCMTACFKYM